MTISVLAFVTINENQPQALAEYFATTTPLLESVGAKIVQRFTLAKSVVGSAPGQTCLVVEYPDMDAVNSVFGSEEYKTIVPARDRAFSAYSVSIVASENAGELPVGDTG